MRFLLGIIFGILLTVGGAYLYDRSTAGVETTGSITSSIDRPMVNWDVVDRNWTRWTSQMRQEWNKLASK